MTAPDPLVPGAMTSPAADPDCASVPAGELAAFGLLMDGAQKALAAVVADNERLRSELAGLENRIDLVIAHAVAKERERAEKAEAKVLEYENAITWNTSCTSCSAVLDSCYAETVRRERAEAQLAAVRQPVENFLAEYGASEIPMFKVGQDLANSIRKILITCGQCDGGLIPYDGCNCGGGGPDGYPAHEPLCGAEPCPNGCWERLHPEAGQS